MSIEVNVSLHFNALLNVMDIQSLEKKSQDLRTQNTDQFCVNNMEPINRAENLTSHVVGATCTASLGSFSLGYVFAYSSPAQEEMQKNMQWSDERFGWFTVCDCLL